MLVYNYHPVSREFLDAEEAFVNPLEPGKFLIPMNSTPVPPPSPSPGYVTIFMGRDGWAQMEDYRGKIAVHIETKLPVEIVGIGPLPDELTFESPATARDIWDGSQWVTPKQKGFWRSLIRRFSRNNE
ncbi:hypothetical protein [Oceanidesulfovibrio marinus]|uniref:Uncharacterized protein n=1 Tax=Oceanidesulfovibrio marinus TaxID=370038 RepID=A0A6P1ZJ16_9BACT|nr:hypothetical protein [Oceanidesulfovibrio marinus]TVM35602.1 hypothetical protein DQK91_02760 [Oceanidesulfovibrio marinus]